jgi:hypothetical protein
MVRTSLTVPFEPTRAPKSQVDRPKFAPSTNPQYQCGFRAIREKTERHSRDALHRPRSSAYSIENTGIPGETTPFREVPKVTPSALQSDFVRNAAEMGWEAAPDVSPTEAHAKVPQKVTPWKNHLAETKPFIGIIARHGVSPCEAITDPSRPEYSPSPKSGVIRICSAAGFDVVKALLPKLRKCGRNAGEGKRKVGVAKRSDNAKIEPLRARQFAFVLGSGRACGAKG